MIFQKLPVLHGGSHGFSPFPGGAQPETIEKPPSRYVPTGDHDRAYRPKDPNAKEITKEGKGKQTQQIHGNFVNLLAFDPIKQAMGKYTVDMDNIWERLDWNFADVSHVFFWILY